MQCLRMVGWYVMISLIFPVTAGAQFSFENPADGATLSGITVFSGWVCDADRLDIDITGPGTDTRLQAAYPTDRADTTVACSDEGTNGFGVLVNVNALGDGEFTATLVATVAGTETSLGGATFTVVTFGQEFATGLSGQAIAPVFPASGSSVNLAWSEPTQNFAVQSLVSVQSGANAFSGTLSGTQVSSTVDVNADGRAGFQGIALIASNLGTVSQHGLVEVSAVAAPTNCPSGESEFQLVTGAGTGVIIDQNGDQLFQSVASLVSCVDPATAAFTWAVSGSYTGGTGVFTGATGSYTETYAGVTRVTDGVNMFRTFTGTHTGTITLP